MFELGFIGCGKMGQALLEGWLEAGAVEPAGVAVRSKSRTDAIAAEHGGQYDGWEAAVTGATV